MGLLSCLQCAEYRDEEAVQRRPRTLHGSLSLITSSQASCWLFAYLLLDPEHLEGTVHCTL